MFDAACPVLVSLPPRQALPSYLTTTVLYPCVDHVQLKARIGALMVVYWTRGLVDCFREGPRCHVCQMVMPRQR